MQDIVDSLSALKGVRHAAIYKQGELTHSHLTEAQQSSLVKSSALIAQVFSAAEAIGKTHDEIFIGVESGYLAGFRLDTGCIAVLLTEKKINFPMISMGIKSASETLKQLIKQEQDELDRIKLLSMVGQVQEVETPTDAALLPILGSYTGLLAEFIGPAAEIVVSDAVKTWKKTYVQRVKNLPYLLALLEAEIESPQDRETFSAKAAEITLPIE